MIMIARKLLISLAIVFLSSSNFNAGIVSAMPVSFTNVRRAESDQLVEYSSVYDDLVKLNVENLHFYQQGLVSENRLITLSESEDKDVFIYVYRINNSLIYNRVDLSVSDSRESEQFRSFDLVEVSSEDYIVKYLIKDVSFNSYVKRRYAVRQIYNTNTQNTLGDTIAVSLEFLVAKNDENVFQMQTNTLKSVVLDGISAFQLNYTGISGDPGMFTRKYHFNQRYFRAFNTSYPLEDILRVDVEINYKIYSGLTNIGYDLTDQNGDKLRYNLNSSKNFTNNPNIVDMGVQYISIEPSTVNYSVIKPWFFTKAVCSYNNIQRTKDDTTDLTDKVREYEWIITYMNNPIIGYMNGSPGNLYWNVNNFVDVETATILTMKVMEYGEIIDLVTIDARHSNSGNETEDPRLTLWQQIIKAFKNIIDGNADISDWFLAILTILVTLIIIWIIAFVFKIFSGMFSIFRRRK